MAPVMSKVTADEMKYRHDTFPDVQKIFMDRINCSVCDHPIKHKVKKGQLFCHLLFETLVCEGCFSFYGDDEFSCDEDGSEKYCRFCGDGGKLFFCSICPSAFCNKCIQKFGGSGVLENEDMYWLGFCCKRTQKLLKQRAICWAAQQYALQINQELTPAILKVTADEMKYRHDTFPDVKKILEEKISCSVCNHSIKDKVKKGQLFCHRLFKTLVCKDCFSFYGDDELSCDEDGSEKYCRCCGDGGKLFFCSKCSSAFCNKCIQKFGGSGVLENEDMYWLGFCCQLTQKLLKQRAICWAAQQYALQINQPTECEQKSLNCSNDEKEITIPKDSKTLSKNRQNKSSISKRSRILKRHLKVIISKISDIILYFGDMTFFTYIKIEKCKRKIGDFKYLCSIDSVNMMRNIIQGWISIMAKKSRKLKLELEKHLKKWLRKTKGKSGRAIKYKPESNGSQIQSSKNEKSKNGEKRMKNQKERIRRKYKIETKKSETNRNHSKNENGGSERDSHVPLRDCGDDVSSLESEKLKKHLAIARDEFNTNILRYGELLNFIYRKLMICDSKIINLKHITSIRSVTIMVKRIMALLSSMRRSSIIHILYLKKFYKNWLRNVKADMRVVANL